MLAPSDMMDGRIGAIKEALKKHGMGGQVLHKCLFWDSNATSACFMVCVQSILVRSPVVHAPIHICV